MHSLEEWIYNTVLQDNLRVFVTVSLHCAQLLRLQMSHCLVDHACLVSHHGVPKLGKLIGGTQSNPDDCFNKITDCFIRVYGYNKSLHKKLVRHWKELVGPICSTLSWLHTSDSYLCLNGIICLPHCIALQSNELYKLQKHQSLLTHWLLWHAWCTIISCLSLACVTLYQVWSYY